MKTTAMSLLAVIMLTTVTLSAQKRITVEVPTDDISKNLDLKAVAVAFGEAKTMEEFEQKINDADSQISNLDLNNDGEVDYLKVVENYNRGVHTIVLQDVISRSESKNVATITVEKGNNDKASVVISGNPEIYGDNYEIEPVYLYVPPIFSIFWNPYYSCWRSPYYWGYYPHYYHHRPIVHTTVYMNNVYRHMGGRYHNNDYGRNDYYGSRHNSNYGSRYYNSRNYSGDDYNRNSYNSRNYSNQGSRYYNSASPSYSSRSNSSSWGGSIGGNHGGNSYHSNGGGHGGRR